MCIFPVIGGLRPEVERHALGVATEQRDASLPSILVALAANTAIAVAKGVAAALTGSSALFAETLHTIADAGNEVFLWIAVRRSNRPPDAAHPLGYGPERYYWALLAAVGMFVIGGAVSIFEGIQALLDPPKLAEFWVGFTVLVIALVLDGGSRVVASRSLRAEAGRRRISRRTLLRESVDPTLTTVYLEDTVDVIGASLALVALVLHQLTGWEWPDAVATIAIGGLLTWVAVHLTRRNRSLLTNQAVPERYVERMRDRLKSEDGIVDVIHIEAVYLGPRSVLAAADVRMDASLDATGAAQVLARVRARIHAEWDVIERIYLTPVP
jgi:cation diffusion facilitator family transporter